MTRLEPAPYTDEDRDIWVCVGLWGPFVLNDALELSSAIGDRRDADLMLHFKKAYADIIGPGYLHYRVWHAACAFTGIPIPKDWRV